MGELNTSYGDFVVKRYLNIFIALILNDDFKSTNIII